METPHSNSPHHPTIQCVEITVGIKWYTELIPLHIEIKYDDISLSVLSEKLHSELYAMQCRAMNVF